MKWAQTEEQMYMNIELNHTCADNAHNILISDCGHI